MDDYIWTTLNDAKSLLHETQVFPIDSIKECYGNWKQYKKALLVIETYIKEEFIRLNYERFREEDRVRLNKFIDNLFKKIECGMFISLNVVIPHYILVLPLILNVG
jgi:hypothetical protein